ncbi:DUF2201 family putative metallopeptidase [Halorhodospira halophila]|uniref:Metal-dependent peptidase n=1 Tax=Halorhodospira halophila (strain DSM 244 / SL1) TaxID=349124 RepID=A1WTN0_HALHL|nr:VWA-like domain-containing protein [Halorhodospira halophila]ABM61042.1 conserved hypothetical protein [Halorhodospira halophila SL1]MBK1730132.1 hypothetical protein [Halorhodospira halophila]
MATEPDPAEPYTHRGTPAIRVMVEQAPGTGGLALWAHHRDVADGVLEGPVANDGRTLYYAPAFAELPRPEQVGWVAHQVLHVALRHAQRREALAGVLGDVDPELFNHCADALVNTTLGHLDWLALPAGAVTLERVLREVLPDAAAAPERALLEWDVERLYRAVDDRRGGSSDSRGRAGQGGGGEASGRRHAATGRTDGPRAARLRQLAAGTEADLMPAAGEPPEVAVEEARAWSERLVRAHADDGAFSMLRGLLADRPTPRTPWEHILRTRLARGLARLPERSWSRPARSWLANRGRTAGGRRMPWEPGIVTARRVPRLALVVDASGSIDDGLLARFAGELAAITRRSEAQLVVIVGDDRVRRVVHLAPGASPLAELQFQGGGGTDFTPLLEAADRHTPDQAVVLTDLQGPCRFRPPWPLLWVVPPAWADAEPPWGERLVLADTPI